VSTVIQKSPFVANVPPEKSREQGLGPTDPEQESGLPPPASGSLEDGTVTEKRSEGSIKRFYREF